MMKKKKIKISSKYKNLFASDTRYTICTGGRGSGKSFSVGSFLSLLTFEYMQRILFTRYTMTSAHISVIPEFNEKLDIMRINPLFEVLKTEIKNKASGNEVLFRGIKTSSGNNTANLKSINGITCWVVDEAEELVDEKTFDTIDLSIRQKGTQNRVILVMNPASTDHWIYKRFFESRGVNAGFNGIVGDTTYIHTTYLDNIKNLDESFLAQVERIKRENPEKYEHVILGGWLDRAEGVIYKNWKFGDFDTSLPYGYGADFGFSVDPDTLVKVAVDHKNKKIYCDEKLYSYQSLGTEELGDCYKKLIDKPNDLIVADNAEGRLIQDLSRSGINIEKCEKGQGSVVAGINSMLDYEFIITPESVNLAKEFRNYVWNNKKAGIPVDSYNDALDAIRYIFRSLCESRPQNNLSNFF